METQKTPNSQSNLEKEKQSWRNQPSDYTIKLQSSLYPKLCMVKTPQCTLLCQLKHEVTGLYKP